MNLRFFFLFIPLVFSVGCQSDSFITEVPEIPEKPANIFVYQVPPERGKYPIIAHRGSWYAHKLPQNSLAALEEALSLDLFGSECDTWKTKDGIYVINHDKTYHGLDITDSNFDQLAAFPLSNGERIPTLDDFLEATGKSPTNTKLVIELKSNAVATEVLDIVLSHGLINKVLFITYYYDKCIDIKNRGYGALAYYLRADMLPAQIKEDGLGGFYYLETKIGNHIEWLQLSRSLGIQLVLGSVIDPSIMKKYLDEGCLFSSNKPVTLVKAIDELNKEQKATE